MPYFKEKYSQYVDMVYDKMRKQIYNKVCDLNVTAYKTKEPVSFDDKTSGERVSLHAGDNWGDLFDCAWFHFTGTVPSDCSGKDVVAVIDVNGEACIFDQGGCPVQGLTCVESDFDKTLGLPGKRIYSLNGIADAGQPIDIWADAGCNDLFGHLCENGTFKEAYVAVCNNKLRDVYYDFQVLIDLYKCLDKSSARYNRILFTLYEASNLLNTFSDEELALVKERITPELERKNGDAPLKFTAIGHSHLDLAWLWPIRETKRKGARTFSTALRLMDRYPDYIFGASQPQLYEWIKQGYPKLYEKVKQKAAEGRWEPQGAMWVEADTNITGGESLVRQLLYGKKFFKEEFGTDIDCLWLPDVFGYSGNLPQILKKSNVPYFMTQKLSWNQHNKFPHQSFIWQGIDGSEVLAHMLPNENYNDPFTPGMMKKGEYNYADNGICDEALMLFGIGDGGGGPGSEHLERAKRLKNMESLPSAQMGFSKDFFARFDAKFRNKLKKWSGELYLENHQGTLTSQAENKKHNRIMELLLREAEFALELCECSDYPRKKLEEIWKEVLLYQFHDVLPGSSIRRVYDETKQRYDILEAEVIEIIQKSYGEIAEKRKGITAFNSLGWDRNEMIRVNGKCYRANVPSLGYGSATEENGPFAVFANDNEIANDYLDVVFHEDGAIQSVWDKKSQKSVLRTGTSGNHLYVYEEKADCWNIPIQYLDKQPESFLLKSQRCYTDGYEAVCEQVYTYNHSVLKQRIVLGVGKKRLDFHTEVDWQENEKMLRASFDVDVKADTASYEIQFGKINRTVHDNTTWDLAQFEACGQKWADISQKDYGVALLNDCKYGYRIKGSILDINLLRSQNYPNVNADRGNHSFTYSFYPHKGDESDGEVSKEAYELNVPLYVTEGNGNRKDKQSLISVNGDVVVETVKRAEKDDAMILRLFEPYGQSTNADVQIHRKNSKIAFCDLMENDLKPAEQGENGLHISFKPFEIVTLKVYF